MFTKLTIVKIIVLILALYGILLSLEQTATKIENGYTDLPSYYPGDTAILYFHNSQAPKLGRITLKDIQGTPVDRVECKVINQGVNPDKPWEKGFGYEPSLRYVIPDTMKSGVYRWDGRVPMIVKNKEGKVDVLVVYPIATLYANSGEGGKSFFRQNSSNGVIASKLSLLRPRTCDNYSNSFLPFIDKYNGNYKIGYITDMDLEDLSSVESTSILLVYGHSQFWTPTAVDNYQEYVSNGGNAMIMTSTVMNNKVWFDLDLKQICLRKCTDGYNSFSNSSMDSWNGCKLCEESGGGYWFGGITVDKSWGGYKIMDNHSLLDGTGLKKGDVLSFPDGLYSGMPFVDSDKEHSLKINFSKEVYSSEIIGFEYGEYLGEPGIGLFHLFRKTKNSGVIIHYGAREWCSKEVLNSKIHQNIIINSIRLLCDKKVNT